MALIVLAAVGWLNAAYFVAVTYGWMRPDSRWVPAVCRMDDATCARVVHTKEARLFGLPNAVYGLGWYATVAGVALAWLIAPTEERRAATGLLIAAAATVAVSAYLAYTLVWRLRTACVLCFAGHGINAAILVVLAWRMLA